MTPVTDGSLLKSQTPKCKRIKLFLVPTVVHSETAWVFEFTELLPLTEAFSPSENIIFGNFYYQPRGPS